MAIEGRFLLVAVDVLTDESKSAFANTHGYVVRGVLVNEDVTGLATKMRFYTDPLGDGTGAIVYNDAGEEINVTIGVEPCVMNINPGNATNKGPLPPSANYAVQLLVAAGTASVQTSDIQMFLLCEPIQTAGE